MLLALITSTNFITGTGFIKCIPTTFVGLPLASAKIPIGILEVFEAKIVLSLQISPRSEKSFSLISIFSTIASIMMSRSCNSLSSKVVLTFPSVLSISF